MQMLLYALSTAILHAYRSRHDPEALAAARAMVAEVMTEIWYVIEGG